MLIKLRNKIKSYKILKWLKLFIVEYSIYILIGLFSFILLSFFVPRFAFLGCVPPIICACVYKFNKVWLVSIMCNYDIIIYGAKRVGKDAFLQCMAPALAKVKHILSTDARAYASRISLPELDLKHTTDDLLNDRISKQPYNSKFELSIIYVSDSNVYLPSSEYNYLNNNYNYLLLWCCLSGNIYDSNIIVNAQAIDKIYDKIRVQQSYYIRVNGIRGLIFKYFDITVYSDYEQALKATQRIKAPRKWFGFVSAPSDAKAMDEAKNGIIKNIKIRLNRDVWKEYNTHYFRSLLTDYDTKKK